jgi:hypothetical protein
MTTKATLLREPISDWSVTQKDGKFQKLFSVPIMDAMPQPDWCLEDRTHNVHKLWGRWVKADASRG